MFCVVGMSFSLPNEIKTKNDFWNLLETETYTSRDSIPNDRWNHSKYFNEKFNRKGYTNISTSKFLSRKKELNGFDKMFFDKFSNIKKKKEVNDEIEKIDVQQIQLLEHTYLAFEDSGLKINEGNKNKNKKVGVYVGQMNNDKLLTSMYERNIIDENTGLGNLSCMSSNRISWFYDFKGPSLNIDTACSSSLISLHYGLNDLKDGIVDLIVVASSNIISNPLYFLTFGKMGVLGNGKSLAKDTTGYTRGEGTIVLLIKRFGDCIKERIPIYCKILGSHINHNGFLNNLISIPSKNAQIDLIKNCYSKLHIQIKDTEYFEVHCTGTKKGDITELRALKELLNEEGHKVYIGNTKRHFGHLESCSALLSIVKAVCVFQRKLIPALIEENETPISLLNENCFVYSNNGNIRWESSKRRISINSFGIGGSNGHIVLEEFIEDSKKELSNETFEDITSISNDKLVLIPITAKSKISLDMLKREWEDTNFGDKYSDLIYWSIFKREFFKYRTVLLLKNKKVIGEVVCDDKIKNNMNVKKDKKILFVFAGQGVQYKYMGKNLFHHEIAFQECMLICDNVIKDIAQFSIIDILFDEEIEMKNSPLITHVLITSVQLSLIYLWNYYNVTPNYVLGHSSGEIAAAYACKALSLEECIKISYYRGKHVEKCINNNNDTNIKYGMGYISGLSLNELQEKLIEYENEIFIACYNSETSFTLSGILEKLKEFFSSFSQHKQRELNSKIFMKIIEEITSPYHSPFLKERIFEFGSLETTMQPKNNDENIKYFSSILGEEIEGAKLDIDYWKSSLYKQVNIVEICQKIHEMKVKIDLVIDLSPHPVLYRILNENKIDFQNFIFSMNRKNKLEVEHEFFLRNLSMLFIHGVDEINWKRLFPYELKNPYCHIESIPIYQFDKTMDISKPFSPKLNYNLFCNDFNHVLLGKKLQTKIQIWENTLSFDIDERLTDHNINNLVIYPASAYLEMGIAVVKNVFPNLNKFELTDVKFLSLLQINDIPNVKIQTIFQNEQIEIYYTVLKSDGVIKEWIKCFSCQVVIFEEKEEEEVKDDGFTCLSTSNKFKVNVRKFYKKHTYYGFKYGKYFKNIKSLYITSSSALCLIDKKNIKDEYIIDPTLLDSCFQSLFAISQLYSSCIPVSIEKMSINLTENNDNENNDNSGNNFIGFGEIIKTEKNRIFADVKFGSINHKIIEIGNIEFEKLEERNMLKDCLSSLKWEKVEIKKEKQYNNNNNEIIYLYCDNESTTQLFLSINEDIIINSIDFNENHKQFMVIFLVSSEFKPNEEYYHLIEVVQKIIKLNERKTHQIKLFIVTFGANKDSSYQVGSSTLFGFGRVLMNEEHNTMSCNLIDLESYIICEDDIRDFLNLIVNFDKNTPPEIAIREKGVVYEPKLYPLQYDLPEKRIETILSSSKNPIIIFGGTRGIGLSIAEYFCSNGVRNLILISKSGGGGEEEENNYSKFSIERMRELYKCQIIIEKVDVLNCEEVESFFTKYKNSSIFGLIFSVSIIDDNLICNMTKDSFFLVQNTKARGIYHIFESIIENKVKFEFSILFSSISSIVGNLGQSNYCAGNSYLENYAYYLRNAYNYPVQVVNFNPISDTGVYFRKHLGGGDLRFIYLLQLPHIFCTIEYLLNRKDIIQIISAKVNWKKLNIPFTVIGNSSKFNEMKPFSIDQDLNNSNHTIVIQHLKENLNDFEKILEIYLIKALENLTMNSINNYELSFIDNGVDSLISVQYSNWINNNLNFYFPSFKFLNEDLSIKDLVLIYKEYFFSNIL